MLKENTELELSLPHCQAEYLVLLFYELGICEQGDNGIKAISWQEIKAWADVIGRNLSYWDINMLKQMSRAYIDEYYSAKDKMRPMPFEDVTMTEEKRTVVKDKFKAWKEAMKANKV